MRELVDPRMASPDVALAICHQQVSAVLPPQWNGEDDSDRLARRDRLVHRLEVSRRRRRRRRLFTRTS